MLYLIYESMRDLIERSTLLGPLNVLRWVEFRAVLAIILAFAFVMLLGRRTIRWLVMQKIGDNPEFFHRDINELMRSKANTPTMGGVLITGAILVTSLLLADLASFYVRMAMVCLIGFALIGFFDDWFKLRAARRGPGARQGLYTWEKLILQIGLALPLCIFIYWWGEKKFTIEQPEILQMSQSLTLPFLKSWVFQDGHWVPNPHLIVLGMGAFVTLAIVFIVGFSNAVNLTDGMDGLAGGISVVVAFAFMVLAIIAGYQNEATGFVLAKHLLVPYIPLADELAVVAGAMMGACLGFLWFNCAPAQVFMGDTGSLPLGGLVAFIAVVIRQEFLLMIIGGVFVMEAASVVLQVAYFKLSGGKRIFRCAPIHHHFHLKGWTEQQVVVRFWLITALLSAAALATIKIR